MEYLISFLEGIITFISPCLLPMLPMYISFFAGSSLQKNKYAVLKNSISFVLGFTVVFIVLGVFAGTVGRLLSEYQTVVNIVSGLIVIIFGLHFIGILKIPILNRTFKIKQREKNLGMLSSLLFGIVFSIGWTPCVGIFLGSALMLSAQQGSILKGILMMLCYSLGLGIPFVTAAVLIEKLKSTFDFIKKHYRTVTIVSGSLLLLIGILMISGYMNYFLSLLTF